MANPSRYSNHAGGVLFLGVFLLKESPRWLAKKGREDEALANLAYMRGTNIYNPMLQAEFQEIVQSTEHEREVSGGASWRELLLKGNRKRVGLGVIIMLSQQFSGTNAIGYYAPQIFAAVGISKVCL